MPSPPLCLSRLVRRREHRPLRISIASPIPETVTTPDGVPKEDMIQFQMSNQSILHPWRTLTKTDEDAPDRHTFKGSAERTNYVTDWSA